jgi:hypothetical protein
VNAVTTRLAQRRHQRAAGALPSPELRRLAFRLLLPSAAAAPRRMVLLGADEVLLRAARSSGVAEIVSDRLGHEPSSPPADLIVVLAEARRPRAADIARELAPHGAVWWETDRRRRGSRRATPRRLAAEMADNGLVVTDSYLLKPDAVRAEWYVPIGQGRALRWFLDGLYAPSSARQLLSEAIVRFVGRLGRRAVATLAPFHGLVITHAGRASRAARFGVSFLPDDAVPADHVALLVHGGERTILFSFGEGAARPSCVVKVANRGDGAGSLVAEHGNTHAVRGHVGRVLAPTIPRSLGIVREPGLALAQEAVGGRSFARATALPTRRFDAKADDLRAVVRWIGDLHRHPVESDAIWDHHSTLWVASQLDAFARCFEPSRRESELFEWTCEQARLLEGSTVPRVWEHGDLTLWNVLIDTHGVRVVDWELARVGLPLADVLRIVDQWHAAVLGMQEISARARARQWLVRPPATASQATHVAREAIGGYMQRLHLAAPLEDVLHVTCLAGLALRQNERRRGGGAPSGERRFNIPAAQLERLARVIVTGGGRAEGES